MRSQHQNDAFTHYISAIATESGDETNGRVAAKYEHAKLCLEIRKAISGDDSGFDLDPIFIDMHSKHDDLDWMRPVERLAQAHLLSALAPTQELREEFSEIVTRSSQELSNEEAEIANLVAGLLKKASLERRQMLSRLKTSLKNTHG